MATDSSRRRYRSCAEFAASTSSLESVRQKITRWGTRPEGHVVGSTSPLDAIDLTADAHSVRASAMIGPTGSTTTTILEPTRQPPSPPGAGGACDTTRPARCLLGSKGIRQHS